MPVLIVRDGPLAGERLQVDRELVIGREGDVAVADAELSRRHLRVKPVPGAIEIEDLGSLNGTWVKGQRIEGRRTLGSGTVVRIGGTTLEVEAGAVREGRRPVTPRDAAPPLAPASGRAAPQWAGETTQPTPFSLPTTRPHGTASRLLGPRVLSFLVIAVTAAALIIYYAQR